ncbi:hypothetical protein BDV41DRAFT_181000 [Aspergillus transmontanensis]|uniref:Uncharacterized protein n=1 Tax=Aspergillus transmontanensis TaxID=1034304 RepID=A0A5N6W4G1_9EURO|nr:hypothetical protein BDV41DRAFT_181000 [Aspergillus transmontanensis]
MHWSETKQLDPNHIECYSCLPSGVFYAWGRTSVLLAVSLPFWFCIPPCLRYGLLQPSPHLFFLFSIPRPCPSSQPSRRHFPVGSCALEPSSLSF